MFNDNTIYCYILIVGVDSSLSDNIDKKMFGLYLGI